MKAGCRGEAEKIDAAKCRGRKIEHQDNSFTSMFHCDKSHKDRTRNNSRHEGGKWNPRSGILSWYGIVTVFATNLVSDLRPQKSALAVARSREAQ